MENLKVSNRKRALNASLLLAAIVVVVSRRLDAVLDPQFWAEDGAVWYANAYNDGAVRSIFFLEGGYLQLSSRIPACLAQLMPLSWGPLFFNSLAIIIQVLPILLLASSRFHDIMPSLKTRMLFGFIYLALPNSEEIHANITSAQWHLALVAIMIVLCRPSDTPWWRVFDIVTVFLSALSGPFCLSLVPVALVKWWIDRNNWRFVLFCIICACALIQGGCIYFSWHTRLMGPPLGASVELFAKLLGGQVFLSALIGEKGHAWLISSHVFGYAGIVAFSTVAGSLILIYTLFKAPLDHRLFTIFCGLVFGTALLSPLASRTLPQWEALIPPGNGQRYWFFPMLTFITALAWMAKKAKPKVLRGISMLTFSLMVVGIPLDWYHHPFVDFNFKEYVERFEASPKGTRIIIPINPVGFRMLLVKH